MPDETKCPICGSEGFDLDYDEVDVGVGVIRGNYRGICPICGEMSQCNTCGKWCTREDNSCPCVEAERDGRAND